MKAFFSPDYQSLLEQQNLSEFDDFWRLPKNWVEPPNERRGGWSGVTTTDIRKKCGETVTLYVKRQHAHTFRSIRYPLSKSTAWREYQNNERMRKKGFSVPIPVFYQEKKCSGMRAIMATIGINNPISLSAWLTSRTEPRDQDSTSKVLQNIATDIRKIHDSGFEYRALHGKHILLENYQTATIPKHYFIDLETLRPYIRHLTPRVRDICQFFRHTPLSGSQQEFFLAHYLIDTPSWAKRFRDKLLKRMIKKTT